MTGRRARSSVMDDRVAARRVLYNQDDVSISRSSRRDGPRALWMKLLSPARCMGASHSARQIGRSSVRAMATVAAIRISAGPSLPRQPGEHWTNDRGTGFKNPYLDAPQPVRSQLVHEELYQVADASRALGRSPSLSGLSGPRSAMTPTSRITERSCPRCRWT